MTAEESGPGETEHLGGTQEGDIARHGSENDSDDVQEEEEKRRVRLGEVVPVDGSMTELEHIGTAGVKVTDLDGVEAGRALESLCLRSNLLESIELISSCTNLVHLELYDNQIRSLRGIAPLERLEVLDMSYNKVKRIEELEDKPVLRTIYLASNKVKKIEGVEHLPAVTHIDLGMNRIRAIEGLSSLTQLEELWLGRNKITRVVGLEPLTRLRRLDLQSNRLTKIEGLATLTNLRELFLGHNGIEKLEGLETLVRPPSHQVLLHHNRAVRLRHRWGKRLGALLQTQLDTLDVTHNSIRHIENLESLTLLEDLWMGSNAIESYEEFAGLGRLTNLKCIYLEHNPIARDWEYRLRLKQAVPSLEQIDATMAR